MLFSLDTLVGNKVLSFSWNTLKNPSDKVVSSNLLSSNLSGDDKRVKTVLWSILPKNLDFIFSVVDFGSALLFVSPERKREGWDLLNNQNAVSYFSYTDITRFKFVMWCQDTNKGLSFPLFL